MDGVFSIDDISDGFWSPHSPPISLHGDADVAQPSSAAAGMNRSSSEWAFQRFLEEAVSPHHTTTTTTTTTFPIEDAATIKLNHHHHRNDNQPPPPPPPKNIPTDPEEYQALLKRRLELACAAVALTRASNNGKATELAAAAAEIGSNSSSTTANGRDSSKMQLADSGAKIDTPPLPAISRKSAIQVRSTTSGSSGDQSDDDEAEGETEDFQNIDPTDKKRMKRMLSNRESARRSRRRKQAHLTERETHVSQLRVENSSLLKRLSDINQKYNESAVDNRVLKADVETLRAKVKMAEESVKRVTGLSSLLHAIPSLPIQDDPTQQIYHPLPNNRLTNDQTIRNEIRGASASGNRGDGEK